MQNDGQIVTAAAGPGEAANEDPCLMCLTGNYLAVAFVGTAELCSDLDTLGFLTAIVASQGSPLPESLPAPAACAVSSAVLTYDSENDAFGSDSTLCLKDEMKTLKLALIKAHEDVYTVRCVMRFLAEMVSIWQNSA